MTGKANPPLPGLIYLDHAATTPVAEEVLCAMAPSLSRDFGNPNSLHQAGRAARRAVEDARAQVARLLKARPHQIIFTPSGTAADNLALKGAAWARREHGNHLITTRIEHHAVLDACRWLERQGFEVTYLPVDGHGRVAPKAVEAALRPETVVVSVMAANNEVGTLQPIAQIGELLKNHPAWFHTDAVQVAGHLPLDVDAWAVDLLSMSAHKFYGPKGVGALYVRDEVELEPLMHGGGQERGTQSGTENVAGIVGMGAAAALAEQTLAERQTHVTGLRDRLIQGVLKSVSAVRLTGHPTLRLPGLASFCFEGVPGESLLLTLDMHGVCVSTGSACTSGRLDPSHVLLAMGIPTALANGSVRMSLGRDTTSDQVDRVLELLPAAVAQVRALAR